MQYCVAVTSVMLGPVVTLADARAVATPDRMFSLAYVEGTEGDCMLRGPAGNYITCQEVHLTLSLLIKALIVQSKWI